MIKSCRQRRATVLLLTWGLLLALDSEAQVRGVRGRESHQAVINVRELAAREAASPPARQEPRSLRRPPAPPRRKIPPELQRRSATTPLQVTTAPAASVVTPPRSPSPAASFAALGDNNTRIPPDTHGAVGPEHLMVTLNSQVAFQTRTGAAAAATVTLDGFWSELNNPSVFDPKVLYDHLAGRWMFTALADARLATSSLLIGVSRTSDPTGTWSLFRIDADANEVSWADYPSVGYNKDWIAVSVNMFTRAADDFDGVKIYLFDKTALYDNTSPAATHTLIVPVVGFTLVPMITHDAFMETLYFVESGWYSDDADSLRIARVRGPVGEETYDEFVAFAEVEGIWWGWQQPGGLAFGPQKDSANKIDLGDDRLQNVIYRNGRLWTAHTVFLPFANPTHSVIQWWEILYDGLTIVADATILQLGRLEDPNGVFFYAYPSIAVNANNDVLIGFSSFSANQYATASYAFRNGSDTPSALQAVVNFKEGEATYFKTFGGSRNRWGDYSNTVVDPVNDTDFWTIQEYAESHSGLLEPYPHRWGTWWAKVNGNPAPVKRRGQTTSE